MSSNLAFNTIFLPSTPTTPTSTSSPMWWTTELIERTVTREFVCSQLIPEEIKRLNRPRADGLTCWDWIETKAKRLFLILLDLGYQDQIFGVIDDGWDDSDLPIPLDQVGRLALTPFKDEKMEKKFYHWQFNYLLKPLQKGELQHYQDMEIVPMRKLPVLHVLPPQSQAMDKVELSYVPGQILCRRRIHIGNDPGCMTYGEFSAEVNAIQDLQNSHMSSFWSAYTHQGHGYILLTPASDFSLKSFLTTTPSSIKDLNKQARRRLVLDWIHCLVDTLSYVHSKGLSLGDIKPSTILFTTDNHVFFADLTRLRKENSFDKESYDYAAPEQWFRPSASSSSSSSASLVSRRSTLTSPPTAASIRLAGPSTHARNPSLNPQAADIFSLGCIILELLSTLLKRPSRAFAAHRSAKHKTPGRGGAVLDASFHKNLGQIESWMTSLAKDAGKKKGTGDEALRGICPMLCVVEKMLSVHPGERPSALEVQTRMYQIITDDSGITEPHCVHQYGAGLEYGMGRSRLAAAASSSMGMVAGFTHDGSEKDTETISSTATKRSSLKSIIGGHARSNSSGSQNSSASASRNSAITNGGNASSKRNSVANNGRDLFEWGSGLQAIQNLRISKAKPWQDASHTGNCTPPTPG